MTTKQAMSLIEQLIVSVYHLIQAKYSLSRSFTDMESYHDNPEPDGEIDTAIEKINTAISQLKREYNIVGFEPANPTEAKGIHTWTWGEVRPMLTNTEAEIEDFSKRYIVHTETVIETTSNSQDITAWEIFTLKNTNGKTTRIIGLRPITGEPATLTIEEANE